MGILDLKLSRRGFTKGLAAAAVAPVVLPAVDKEEIDRLVKRFWALDPQGKVVGPSPRFGSFASDFALASDQALREMKWTEQALLAQSGLVSHDTLHEMSSGEFESHFKRRDVVRMGIPGILPYDSNAPGHWPYEYFAFRDSARSVNSLISSLIKGDTIWIDDQRYVITGFTSPFAIEVMKEPVMGIGGGWKSERNKGVMR